ncbi:MAG TPA: thioredoxin TrxC [Gammaproteobacteria bacterium]|nr:thioredoxin TrxC [Gammaproteobacteria bacterium]
MAEALHIACPDCGVVNRVPTARLSQAPKCGQCHTPLFNAGPRAVHDTNFQNLVQHTDLPVIVDCWAQWCGPCKMFAPVFEQAARTLEPGFRLLKLDTDANPQTSAGLNIRSIPTLIAFRNGREVGRTSGAMPLAGFLQWAKQFAD